MRPAVSRAALASALLAPRAVGASLVAARCASSAASPYSAAATTYGEIDMSSLLIRSPLRLYMFFSLLIPSQPRPYIL
jgi:hypothetical protein